MALNSAISILGSPAALAAAIGVSPQVVTNWRARERVPAEYCPAIEKATKGAVTCESLRHDVDWAYLRKTCRKKAA
jgi:DNA-binding transcriptional regulator YdaS (Cro superfamily)